MAQFIHEFKITGPQMTLTFVAPAGETTIGRGVDNDLVFVHPLVSRRHARLNTAPDMCQIVDLNSTHGTMVNRLRIEAQKPLVLQPGDVLEIGAFRMVYEQIALVQAVVEPELEPDVEAEPEIEVEVEVEPVMVVEERVEEVGETAVTPPPQPAPTPYTAPTAPYTPIPPQPPQPPAPDSRERGGNGRYTPPPGLASKHSSYLQYLPDIYHTGPDSFLTRFLALLESILAPIEWNIDNFDLYLDAKTSPTPFLPWLANWFEIIFDDSWSDASQRQLLAEAKDIYPRRGTVWALRRILEIYTGTRPEIDDQSSSLEPFTFTVRFPLREQQVNRAALERIINANKPAHTNYSLIFQA
jgi:phage tail-like protein